jgi:hypothetical protein
MEKTSVFQIKCFLNFKREQKLEKKTILNEKSLAIYDFFSNLIDKLEN